MAGRGAGGDQAGWAAFALHPGTPSRQPMRTLRKMEKVGLGHSNEVEAAGATGARRGPGLQPGRDKARAPGHAETSPL